MSKRNAAIVCTATQFIAAAALVFLPFGFDHPSSIGLDFTALVFVLLAYCVALIAGVIAAALARRHVVLWCQGAILTILIFRGATEYYAEANSSVYFIEEDEHGNV